MKKSKLKVVATGATVEFDLAHAERILQIQDQPGYPKAFELADSKYDYIGGQLVDKPKTQSQPEK